MGRACVLALVLVGCFARGAEEPSDQVGDVERTYARAAEEIEAAHAQAAQRITTLLTSALVATEPRNRTRPLRSVDEQPAVARVKAECAALERELDTLRSLGSPTRDLDVRLRSCHARWTEARETLLVETYWAAGLDWVRHTYELDPGTMKLESLLVYSHNARLRAFADHELAILRAARSIARRELDGGRDAVIAGEARTLLATPRFADAVDRARRERPQPPRAADRHASASVCTTALACGANRTCVRAEAGHPGTCEALAGRRPVAPDELPAMEWAIAQQR